MAKTPRRSDDPWRLAAALPERPRPIEPTERAIEAPSTAAWTKAREVVRARRRNLQRRKGVVGVHLAPALDADGRPTGEARIIIEVREKFDKRDLPSNQRFPKTYDDVPVNVVDIRGDILLGDADAYRQATRARPSARALAVAATPVGPSSPIVPVDDRGNPLGGWGTACAVVLTYDPSPHPYFLTCSHVLANGPIPLDRVRVGDLDQPTTGVPDVGTAVGFPTRGHDAQNDCALIEPNFAAVPADMTIIYLIADPPGSTDFIPPPAELDGHYRVGRLTTADRDAGTRVRHLGRRTGGLRLTGTVIGVDSAFDGRNTPINTGLIAIQGPPGQPFVAGGDSGGLLLRDADNAVVGMIVGMRDDGVAVACHFDRVIAFFAGTSLPVDL